MQSEEQKSLEGNLDMSAMYAALAKAQAEFKVAVFDKKSNYGKYASFKSVREASIEALSKHGLSVVQPLEFDGTHYTLKTILNHSSGRSMSSGIRLILDRNNMQGLGSAVTYARRYALAALIGIVSDDDDDGNAAVGSPHKPPQDLPPKNKPAVQKKPPVKNFAPADQNQLDLLDSLMNERGISEEAATYFLKEVYKASPSSIPSHAAAEMIELLKFEGANDATLMAAAVKKENEQKAAAKLLDPGDAVIKIGTQTTGKRMRDIPETKLKEMLTWARAELRKNPTGAQTAVIAEFQAQATEFLKSMGVEV